jgi:hypothetical protein
MSEGVFLFDLVCAYHALRAKVLELLELHNCIHLEPALKQLEAAAYADAPAVTNEIRDELEHRRGIVQPAPPSRDGDQTVIEVPDAAIDVAMESPEPVAVHPSPPDVEDPYAEKFDDVDFGGDDDDEEMPNVQPRASTTAEDVDAAVVIASERDFHDGARELDRETVTTSAHRKVVLVASEDVGNARRRLHPDVVRCLICAAPQATGDLRCQRCGSLREDWGNEGSRNHLQLWLQELTDEQQLPVPTEEGKMDIRFSIAGR